MIQGEGLEFKDESYSTRPIETSQGPVDRTGGAC